MLKFIKHHMTTIDGIELFPIVSLLIFVGLFSAMLWFVFTTDKRTIAEVERMPLNNNEESDLFI